MSDGDKKTVEVGPLTKSPVAATPPATEPPAGTTGPAPVLVTSPPPDRPRQRPSSARKWIGIVTLGVGVGVIGYGGIVGLDAIGRRDDAVAAGCDSDLSDCPNSMALELADSAYTRANVSTAIVIGGSVLAVTGIILWATAPSASDYQERTAWRVTPTFGRGSGGLAFTGAF